MAGGPPRRGQAFEDAGALGRVAAVVGHAGILALAGSRNKPARVRRDLALSPLAETLGLSSGPGA
ncbi:hypothetical protein B2G69_07690 [Methylorubrum zatmanii]|nr:hypothetical protein B2G69_07690 [Methylorubrum zatmanii]